MTEPWWAVHPPVQVVVACSGGEHRVRWHAGRLEALDHGDPDGERTLAALGGTPCRCVELLDAWHRHADDLRIVTLASRGPGDVLTEARRGLGRGGRHGPQVRLITAPRSSRPGGSWPAEGLTAGDDLLVLLGAGPLLWDRLVATVVATWAERSEAGDERCGPARATLVASLSGRATLALRRWLGDPDVEVDVAMVGPTDPPGVAREGDRVVVRLPYHWLRDCWSPGLTVLFGRFCLGVAAAGERRHRVLAVGRELGAPETLTVTVGGE